MTLRGAEQLRERLKQLKEIERPKNVRDIEEARAHGDLRENAEYHAAKEKQGFIMASIRDIEDKLSRAEIFDTSKLSGDRVIFGATVRLLDVDRDEESTYFIVGEDEADVKGGLLNIGSPLARALIGKRVGDEVAFRAPGGQRNYEVLAIEFK
jgi:transcription elongation factor GreA